MTTELYAEVFRSAQSAPASDVAFMLTAVGIAAVMNVVEGGYAVYVEATEVGRARDELIRYAQESRPAPPPEAPLPLKRGAFMSTAVAGVVLLAVAGAAGRDWFARDWYAAGALDGVEVRAGAWWRAVTALTLHADLAHLTANLGFGALFGAACAALYGPGLGWLLVVAAATLANLVEAAWMPPGMRSIGASTAVFAALGLVTARGRRAIHGRGIARGFYGALVAGLLLLALLGTGEGHTDVLAHALGFSLGVAAGLPIRHARLADRTLDRICGAGALLLPFLAWAMALRTAG